MTRSDEIKKRFEEIEQEKRLIEAEQVLKDIKSNQERARSITVGTAFGGTTEISMRGDGGAVLWCLLQPVEVTELIHQLASNIGCHLAIKPREDFASWRDWKVTDQERISLNGWAPFVNDMAPYQQIGAKLPAPEHQPGLNNTNTNLRNKDEPLAITKTINKRKSKRTTTIT